VNWYDLGWRRREKDGLFKMSREKKTAAKLFGSQLLLKAKMVWSVWEQRERNGGKEVGG
jgi:hypothetical protein